MQSFEDEIQGILDRDHLPDLVRIFDFEMDSAIYCPAGLNTLILRDGSHFVEGGFGQVVVEGIGKPSPLLRPVPATLRPQDWIPGRKVSLELKAQ